MKSVTMAALGHQLLDFYNTEIKFPLNFLESLFL